MAIDIILRLVAQGAASVRDDIRSLGAAGRDAAGGVDEAGAAAERMHGRFEALRNAGAILAGIGVAGLALSNELIKVAREAEHASLKLEAMAAKRGEGGRVQELQQWAAQLAHDAALVDDDPIKEAAAGLFGFGVNANQVKEIMPGLIGQSRLYGQSLESVAMQMGKAFAKGDVSGLTRAGITINPADIAKLKAIEGHAEKQAFLFQLVKKSMDEYALSITEGMSEAEKAANRNALAIDDIATALGTGASKAKKHTDDMIASLLGVVGANKTVLESAGYVGYIGSQALVAGGSVLALTGQIGMTVIGLQAMGITGTRAFAAIRTGAIAAATAVRGLMLGPLGIIAAVVGIGFIIDNAVRAQQEYLAALAEGKDRPTEGDTKTREGMIARSEAMMTQAKKLRDEAEEEVPGWQKLAERGLQVVTGGASAAASLQGQVDARNQARLTEAEQLEIQARSLRKRADAVISAPAGALPGGASMPATIAPMSGAPVAAGAVPLPGGGGASTGIDLGSLLTGMMPGRIPGGQTITADSKAFAAQATARVGQAGETPQGEIWVQFEKLILPMNDLNRAVRSMPR